MVSSNMNKNFNRILAYGCSYTAGDEIMDHIVMGVSFEECNQWKRDYLKNKTASLSYTAKFKQDFNIKWDDPLHRNSSWAAQLAELLDLSFENRAMNGSGIDEQYLKIYSDYSQGLILDNDLVLVGLTSMNRMIDFRLKEKITTLISKNIPNDVGSKLYLDMYNDDYVVFHYFKTLKLFNDLATKIQLMMQPMTNDMMGDQLDKLNLPHTRVFAELVWKESINNILLPEEFLRLPVIDSILKRCEFGHPPLESHIELAKKIHKQIKF